MVHRIFIAINIPEAVKKELCSFKDKWPELPARWTKPENLHITLIFYGNASDKELQELKILTEKILQKHKSFSLKLSKILYGPNPARPRMVWAIGDTPKELSLLQEELAKALNRQEERVFSLHITLARLREWEFRRMDLEERPEIDEKIDIDIPVNSIDIMESKLKRGGAEYSVIDHIKLHDG